MAGGVPPKPAATRARRNKKSTATTLVADPNAEIPDLPEKVSDWHPETVAEWASIWASPMASEYIDTDYYGLAKLIVLVDDFWHAESSSARNAAMVEIRLQRQDFGLSTLSRNRLQWEIDRGESAADTRVKRQTRRETSQAVPNTATDPRQLLGRQGGLVALPGGRA